MEKLSEKLIKHFKENSTPIALQTKNEAIKLPRYITIYGVDGSIQAGESGQKKETRYKFIVEVEKEMAAELIDANYQLV